MLLYRCLRPPRGMRSLQLYYPPRGKAAPCPVNEHAGCTRLGSCEGQYTTGCNATYCGCPRAGAPAGGHGYLVCFVMVLHGVSHLGLHPAAAPAVVVLARGLGVRAAPAHLLLARLVLPRRRDRLRGRERLGGGRRGGRRRGRVWGRAARRGRRGLGRHVRRGGGARCAQDMRAGTGSLGSSGRLGRAGEAYKSGAPCACPLPRSAAGCDAIHQLKGALHCCGLDGRHAEGGRAPGSGSCAIRQSARHKWEWGQRNRSIRQDECQPHGDFARAEGGRNAQEPVI